MESTRDNGTMKLSDPSHFAQQVRQTEIADESLDLITGAGALRNPELLFS